MESYTDVAMQGLPHEAWQPISGTTIVVVDDDWAICNLLDGILTDEGYRVVCVSSGGEALACIRHQRPGAVLLDLHLCGSIDGLSVVELLRADPSTADTPIIVSTGDRRFLRERVPELSMFKCGVLPKPFDIDDLLACVQRAINPSTLETAA